MSEGAFGTENNSDGRIAYLSQKGRKIPQKAHKIHFF